MERNNDGMLKFMELYKAKPVIWGRTRPKYYNEHPKYDASEESTKGLGF
jgi:hypothetical protein